MDDAFLMGVLNRLADLNEEIEPFTCGKPVLVAELGDLGAPNQFHDKVGPASLRRAAIQDLGDVRMIHHSQRLPLRLKPRNDALGIHAQLDYFESNPAFDRFLLLGHIHHTAAAFADFLEQLIAADPSSQPLFRRDGKWNCIRGTRRADVGRVLQEFPELGLRFEEVLDPLAQGGLGARPQTEGRWRPLGAVGAAEGIATLGRSGCERKCRIVNHHTERFIESTRQLEGSGHPFTSLLAGCGIGS